MKFVIATSLEQASVLAEQFGFDSEDEADQRLKMDELKVWRIVIVPMITE